MSERTNRLVSQRALPGLSRRRLLWTAGTLGLAAGCDRIFSGVDRVASERAEKMVFHAGSRARSEPERAKTKDDDFPSYFIGPTPPAVPAGWRFAVGGMVGKALLLSLAELQKLPRTDIRVRHYCVEGWSAVADWHGVQLSEIARLAGADPKAACIEFNSFDIDAEGTAYSTSWDLGSAMHPQTILAYGMNGAPLGLAHGAPLRLYAGVKLGYKMCKYLTGVRFTPSPTGGYWENQGYEWFAGV